LQYLVPQQRLAVLAAQIFLLVLVVLPVLLPLLVLCRWPVLVYFHLLPGRLAPLVAHQQEQ
jgi:hypothetical protein